MKGYQKEDAAFVLPLFFEADCIVCREEMTPYVENLSDLAEYLEAHPDEPGELYEDGKVTEEKLEAFLLEAKILYNRLMSNEATDTPPYLLEYKDSAYIMEEEFWQLLGCGKGNVSLSILGRLGIWLFPQISHYEGFEIVPTGQFHSDMLAGVHSQTKCPEEACDFLQFLVSYTGTYSQKSRSISGIPIARKSIAAYGEGYPLYFPVKEDSVWLEELLDHATAPRGYTSSLTDSIYAILAQGIDGYFEGEKPLETTVDELYRKISIKQSEEE